MVNLTYLAEGAALKSVLFWLRRGTIVQATHRSQKLARLGWRLLHSERAWCQRNLQLIYGSDLRGDLLNRLSMRIFENIFTSHMEGVRARDLHVRSEGMDRLHEAFQRGGGVIVCSIHLGCWEAGVAHLAAAGFPLAVVYRHANNPLSEKLFQSVRSSDGVIWIRRDDTRAAWRSLKAGKVLILMTDINTRRGGVAAPFLGLPALSPQGPARLALRQGVPVVPIVATRMAPGEAMLRVMLPMEPLLTEKKQNTQEIVNFTEQINAVFEPWIHHYAEQYNWLHARWRSRPNGELWQSEDPLSKMVAERVVPHPLLSERVQSLIGL